MKHVMAKVIEKVKPSDAEVRANAKMFAAIKEFIKKKFGLDAALMGSVQKDTFLAGDKDLDTFIFFPTKTTRKEMEEKALEVGKTVFRHFSGTFIVKYAEHPYTKGKIKGFDVEIIPAYKIKNTDKLFSAVDRTPFHTQYVCESLEKGDNDEVRLLKKFLKGCGLYGSDLKTEGFSGYLCELLVIRYGNFVSVLEEAQNWKYQEIIDIENVHSHKECEKIRESFAGQPLIFIDPTDQKRNVAAVLSKEKYARFIFHARNFLEKPGLKYFFPKDEKISPGAIVKDAADRGTSIVVLQFDKPDIIDDILYPQLRRFRKHLVSALESNGFNVLHSWVFGDKECGIGLELLITQIPKYKTVLGPSIFNDAKFQKEFVKKYKKAWFEGDRFAAEVERKHRTLRAFLKDYFSRTQKDLVGIGVPGNIATAMMKGFTLFSGKDIARMKGRDFWNGFLKEKVSVE